MQETVMICYGGGYYEARIQYNHVTNQWDVVFFVALADDPNRTRIDQRMGVKSFNNPLSALLWIARKDLLWMDPVSKEPNSVDEGIDLSDTTVPEYD